MIKYLIHRPTSVMMAVLALFILGIVTYMNIPVSLLPDIAIPEVTVQVSGQNTSARELENTVVRPLRQQLMQESPCCTLAGRGYDRINLRLFKPVYSKRCAGTKKRHVKPRSAKMPLLANMSGYKWIFVIHGKWVYFNNK
jgi:hypothetical protein